MERLVKGFILLFVCILVTAFSSGQEKFGTELVDLMVIQGIAIDKTDNGYKVTVQAINNTQNSYVSGQSGPENMSKQYSSEGFSVSDALEGAVKLSGKKPLYAQNRVVIIGEETAKAELARILDFFIRDFNTKPTVMLAIARGSTAEELMSAQVGSDALVSQLIQSILEQSVKYGEANTMRVFEAINYILDDTAGLCIPAISLDGINKTQGESDAEKKERVIFLNGLAVFSKENKLLGYLNDDETLGMMILDDELEEGIFQVTAMDGVEKAILNIEGLKTRTKVRYENGRFYVDEKVTLHCDLIEICSEQFVQLDKTIVKDIERAAGEKIVETAQKAVYASQQKYGIDLFRYGRRLWLFKNKDFEGIADRWPEIYKDAKITITAEVVLRRTGEETLF